MLCVPRTPTAGRARIARAWEGHITCDTDKLIISFHVSSYTSFCSPTRVEYHILGLYHNDSNVSP